MRLSKTDLKNKVIMAGFEVLSYDKGFIGIRRGKIKGASGCSFSHKLYYVNDDDFIVYKPNGAIVDVAMR
ncbi:hypothetical protein [Campylobacter pinnipediorum]|uniref:hypothetical protein n=1 Tax=Campylobacter pinnipediorum TaxID=1965231 RepID=UPI0009959D2F|nr:hypothetical protein [Campylobacter pinnipediorum]AQW81256.1 hypothetical protein CPIN17260_0959 [Campylobacter pinnipediorum subsp. pinnipediorum]AQW82876.1 hypothetical protein CPIN17261_0866 [Campylobacter pinnipediorum subsp. pinnipediorum]